jgi:hypothetical protein
MAERAARGEQLFHPTLDAKFPDRVHRTGYLDNRGNTRILGVADDANCTPIRPGKSSRFVGVDWHPNSGRWRAQISIKHVQIYLGLFDTEEEAAAAFKAAARELRGRPPAA